VSQKIVDHQRIHAGVVHSRRAASTNIVQRPSLIRAHYFGERGEPFAPTAERLSIIAAVAKNVSLLPYPFSAFLQHWSDRGVHRYQSRLPVLGNLGSDTERRGSEIQITRLKVRSLTAAHSGVQQDTNNVVERRVVAGSAHYGRQLRIRQHSLPRDLFDLFPDEGERDRLDQAAVVAPAEPMPNLALRSVPRDRSSLALHPIEPQYDLAPLQLGDGEIIERR
jgi:hypothetical protein